MKPTQARSLRELPLGKPRFGKEELSLRDAAGENLAVRTRSASTPEPRAHRREKLKGSIRQAAKGALDRPNDSPCLIVRTCSIFAYKRSPMKWSLRRCHHPRRRSNEKEW
eukprot:scaffold15_cov234-Pinguiococcus_pyrenoidosus.AAC.11